jgi:hypothetical protein
MRKVIAPNIYNVRAENNKQLVSSARYVVILIVQRNCPNRCSHPEAVSLNSRKLVFRTRARVFPQLLAVRLADLPPTVYDSSHVVEVGQYRTSPQLETYRKYSFIPRVGMRALRG